MHPTGMHSCYHLQTKFAKVMFLHVSVCPQGWGWYPSMPCRSSGPHPGGRLRGLACVGSPGPHPAGGSPGPHLGPTPEGMHIPPGNQRKEPPGPETGTTPPPLGDMGNKQAVCIPLECILVYHEFSRGDVDPQMSSFSCRFLLCKIFAKKMHKN